MFSFLGWVQLPLLSSFDVNNAISNLTASYSAVNPSFSALANRFCEMPSINTWSVFLGSPNQIPLAVCSVAVNKISTHTEDTATYMALPHP